MWASPVELAARIVPAQPTLTGARCATAACGAWTGGRLQSSVARAAPEQPWSSRCSTPLPLTHCSCARAGARQLLGRWQGYSGVNVGVAG